MSGFQKKLTTSHILIWKFYRAQFFEKYLHFKNHVSVHFSPWKRHNLQSFCFFSKSLILKENIIACLFFEMEKRQRVTFCTLKEQGVIFDLENIQRVSLCVSNFTTCQILSQLFKHASDFEVKILEYVRFWVYMFAVCQVFMCWSKQGTFW